MTAVRHATLAGRPNLAAMRTGMPPALALALVLALVDGLGRMAIAQRLPGGATFQPLAAALACAVLLAVFSAGQRVRSDALLLLVPACALGVIGDLIAVRMHAGGLTDTHGGQFVAAVVFVMALATLGDRRRVSAVAPLLGMVGLALVALPLVPLIGLDPVHGQFVNAGLGPLRGQPGELGRPLVLIGMAATFANMPMPAGANLDLEDIRPHLGVALLLPLLAAGITAAGGDLGPAALLMACALLMVAIVTGRGRFLLAGAAALLVLLALGYLLAPGRVGGRLGDLVHPFANGDNQIALARQWLAWGRTWGVGLGGGVVNSHHAAFLPASATDLSLVAWGTELGLAGLLACLALECALVWGLFTLSMRAPAGFFRLSGCALSCLVAVQVGWVVGATCGFLPLTGISIPLISTGRSAALGIALVCAWVLRLPVREGEEIVVRGVDPRRMVAVLRLGAVVVLAACGVAAATQLRQDARLVNRQDDNHVRWLSALVSRGPIASHDGARLAWTSGLASYETAQRRYGHSEVADLVGRAQLGAPGTGVESAYQAALRCAGSGQAPADAPSQVVQGDPASCRPAGVTMTLDLRLQQQLRDALAGTTGAIVVMDTGNGAVEAMTGQRVGARDPQNLQMAARTAVAPGSVFKAVTAAAALGAASGVRVSTTTAMMSAWQVPWGPVIHNGGGETCGGSLEQAFAISCNTHFAQLALRVGPGPLESTASLMGLTGRMPLSGLPTVPGQVFTRGISPPSDAAVAASGFGQGTDTATTLGLARMTATIASGGAVVTPTLVERVCDGAKTLASLPSSTGMTNEHLGLTHTTAGTVGHLMRAVATSGTARVLRAPGAWAVKTGTPQLPPIAVAGTTTGTGGIIVGFPTRGPAAHRVAVAVMLLPDLRHPARSGPADAVAVLQRIAPAVIAGQVRRQQHAATCPLGG